jgi:hypothetical protein
MRIAQITAVRTAFQFQFISGDEWWYRVSPSLVGWRCHDVPNRGARSHGAPYPDELAAPDAWSPRQDAGHALSNRLAQSLARDLALNRGAGRSLPQVS